MTNDDMYLSLPCDFSPQNSQPYVPTVTVVYCELMKRLDKER